MEEDIEVVAFACRGTLLDWTGAIEAVVYELARRNGESPLDRGIALRRRVEALADGHGLARGFERLARERGYRVRRAATSRSRAWSRWRARCGAPASRGARGPVRETVGRRLPRREPGRAVRVRRAVRGRGLATRASSAWRPDAMLYVSAAAWRREEARSLGMRAVAPAQLGPARSSRPADHLGGLMSGLAVTPISTTEAVVVSLREQILDGAIAPGAPLPGGRPDARVRRRAPDGARGDPDALPRGPARSASATAARSSPCSTRDDVLDLFSVRIPIECLIVRAGARARRAARRASTPRSAAWTALTATTRTGARSSTPTSAFHHALARAVGSPRLERLYLLAERRDPALHRPAAAGLGRRRRRWPTSTASCST